MNFKSLIKSGYGKLMRGVIRADAYLMSYTLVAAVFGSACVLLGSFLGIAGLPAIGILALVTGYIASGLVLVSFWHREADRGEQE